MSYSDEGPEYIWEGITMGQYWLEEEPKVFQTSQSELRYYAQAGKLQVYQRKAGTAHGVTKGVVIDLAQTDPLELTQLASFIYDCVKDHLDEMADEAEASIGQ